MPKSVDKDGAVRGSAPLGSSSVVSLRQYSDKARQMKPGVNEAHPVQTASNNNNNHTNVGQCGGQVDKAARIQAELDQIRSNLLRACQSQRQNETRLETVSGNLLIGGERIPTLDQKSPTMMQEAYLNASTTVLVGAEKIIILREHIARLQTELVADVDQNKDDFLKAA